MFSAAIKSGSAGTPKDAQFPYVTMLLHGDGTNGAQNNTFLDSSTNNFTITRNGNTTQGTFSPYGSNWSNYFNGVVSANQSLTASPTAVGTSNFTVEFWFYYLGANSDSSDQQIYDTGTNGFSVYISGGAVNVYNRVASASIFGSSTAITANSWVHIAFVRSGTGASQTVLYVNGTSSATATLSTNFTSTTVSIGGRFAVSGASWNTVNGYVSNVRYNSTAVYSGAFTPSTTPLTAISGTVLLTCQSNRFIDNSTNAYTITVNSTPSVQRFNPFSPTTAYSTSVIGGSGYFDGSGDTITFTDSGNILDMGGVVASLEMWVYPTAATNASHVFGKYGSTWSWSTSNGIEYAIAYQPAGFYLVYNNSGSPAFVTDPTARSINQWYHVAIASDTSNNLSLFVNGIRVATTTTGITKPTTRTGIIQGGNSVGSETFTGYIANMNFILGSGAYSASSSTITIPTAPSTVVTNTKLLVNYTNAGILDNAMMNDLETVGNAQISTSVKKYGTGSMYFDGTGDYLSTITSPNLNMSTGNWTIECWVYILSRTLNYPLIFGNNNGGYTAGALSLVNSNADSASYNDRFCLSVKDHLNAPTLVASSTNSTNTWYHLAVVRNGTSLVMYRDGTSVASATISSGIVFDWGKLGSLIGGGNWDGAQSYFNGYIDDLRITKGVARYTANFTAPTAAFPNN